MSKRYPDGRPYPENRRAKVRSVSVPDEVWEAAKAEAAYRGETLTAVVVRALRDYASSSKS